METHTLSDKELQHLAAEGNLIEAIEKLVNARYPYPDNFHFHGYPIERALAADLEIRKGIYESFNHDIKEKIAPHYRHSIRSLHGNFFNGTSFTLPESPKNDGILLRQWPLFFLLPEEQQAAMRAEVKKSLSEYYHPFSDKIQELTFEALDDLSAAYQQAFAPENFLDRSLGALITRAAYPELIEPLNGNRDLCPVMQKHFGATAANILSLSPEEFATKVATTKKELTSKGLDAATVDGFMDKFSALIAKAREAVVERQHDLGAIAQQGLKEFAVGTAVVEQPPQAEAGTPTLNISSPSLAVESGKAPWTRQQLMDARRFPQWLQETAGMSEDQARAVANQLSTSRDVGGKVNKSPMGLASALGGNNNAHNGLHNVLYRNMNKDYEAAGRACDAILAASKEIRSQFMQTERDGK